MSPLLSPSGLSLEVHCTVLLLSKLSRRTSRGNACYAGYIEGKGKLSTDPLTAILASLDHFHELERPASESPAFPFLFTVSTTQNLKRQ